MSMHFPDQLTGMLLKLFRIIYWEGQGYAPGKGNQTGTLKSFLSVLDSLLKS